MNPELAREVPEEVTTQWVYTAAYWAMMGFQVEIRQRADDPSRFEFVARMRPTEARRLEHAFVRRYKAYARHCQTMFQRLTAAKDAMRHGREGS